MTKTCRHCGQDKSVSEFYRSAKTKGGYDNACKMCWSLRYRAWRARQQGGVLVCDTCHTSKPLADFGPRVVGDSRAWCAQCFRQRWLDRGWFGPLPKDLASREVEVARRCAVIRAEAGNMVRDRTGALAARGETLEDWEPDVQVHGSPQSSDIPAYRDIGNLWNAIRQAARAAPDAQEGPKSCARRVHASECG